jgi:KUP system potassium uptake protein
MKSRETNEPPVGLARIVGALGIVFGDIATSPLYTFQECFAGPHRIEASHVNVLGCASLVVWALILVVSFKYVAVLMRADNRGEGGIMALLALVPRRVRERAPGTLGTMTGFVLVGAAFLFGDGIITPAISVLSAVEGLRVASSELEHFIVPVTVAILVALFAVQSRGSGRLGRFFGPLMAVWLLTAGGLGAVHVLQRPGILGALSPHHGLHLLAGEGPHGLRVLGGVVLAVTGCEALYADMGHFGRTPIRIGWYAFVFPMLALCYLGQGAMLLDRPEAARQPFYAMVPSGTASYPFVAIGTAATIIASQALITGVFSLVHQSVQLGYFPRVTVRHTSREEKGQIYIPLLNALLAVSCIGLVLFFRESSRLAAAYGLAVSATMTVTSLAFYTVARVHFRWSALAAGLLTAAFLVVDVAFFGANLLKFYEGGYIPVIVGLAFFIVMAVWARGRSLLGDHFRLQSERPATFLARLDQRIDRRLPGVSVVMTASSAPIPPVLTRMVNHFRCLHETVLITTVVTEEIPYVLDDRTRLEEIGRGLYRLHLRYGFMEEPHIHDEIARMLDRVAPGRRGCDLTYVLGHERLVASPGGRMGRIVEGFFALLLRNARNPSDFFGLPPAQVVELGARIDL